MPKSAVPEAIVASSEGAVRTLLQLIAQGRLVRQSAENSELALVAHHLNQRNALIQRFRQLSQANAVPIEDAEPLLQHLAREDAQTLEQLVTMRDRLATELSNLRGSQQALAGYSRLAQPSASLLEKDL